LKKVVASKSWKLVSGLRLFYIFHITYLKITSREEKQPKWKYNVSHSTFEVSYYQSKTLVSQTVTTRSDVANKEVLGALC